MSQTIEVHIPDIGDFDEVDVAEVLVQAGDRIKKEQELIVLESDKASMEIPSPAAGVVKEVKVQPGDQVAQDALILTLEVEEDASTDAAEASEAAPPASPEPPSQEPAPAPEASPATTMPPADLHAEVLVLGSGPGGYTAAFRAADLDKQVVMVERYADLGGVCLNVGCIPSKALLHLAKVVDEARVFGEHGVTFGEPSFDLDAIRTWKDEVVGKLTGGVAGMAKQRKVEVVQGFGRFTSPHTLEVESDDGSKTISFDHAIIAAGSRVVELPDLPYDDPRLMDSTSALEIDEVPERLLILGGGIIGLEMATVYSALGSKITVVELLDGLIPGCDGDIVRRLQRFIQPRYENIFLGTRVTGIKPRKKGLEVFFEGKKAPASDIFDRVLSAVGRRPNGDRINAEAAGVKVDERGFIPADRQLRTNVPHIFAIGDIVGQPMLAHKAMHEGKVAAEVIAGLKSSFDARVIPSVAYTDPEVAWVGLTETEAKAQGVDYGKGNFLWSASGRSLSLGRSEGATKLLFDKKTRRVIGAGIVGPAAGDLIAEVALAIEMGCEAEDIGLTVHPHPTLSETVALSAEVFEGTVTDIYLPRKKKA